MPAAGFGMSVSVSGRSSRERTGIKPGRSTGQANHEVLKLNLTNVLLSVFVICGVIVITAAVIIGSGILIEIGKVEERKAEERE